MAGVLVSASTGAMGSLLGKLATMLSNQYKLLKDVRCDIQFLKDELEVMNEFLVKMSEVEEPDGPTKLRVKAVREMSYDIEDNIDKFMVLVEGHQSSSEDHGVRKLIGKCKNLLPDVKTRHKIAKEVKGIKNQLKEVHDRFSRYKIDESSSKPERVDPRLQAVYKDTAELVGTDGPRDELINWLEENKGESLKVMSIFGSGGLGKTTLAQQVRGKIAANFECQAFVPISRRPNVKEILGSILSQIGHQGSGYAELRVEQLIDKTRGFLNDKRYFIIIDDLWDVPTWSILKCAFVHNRCGSRLMITTRINDVAKSCCPFDEDLVYKMKPLCEEDSKKLFFKRIFGCEDSCPADLEEASKDILKKCGGLPLAINAISSLLATTRQTKEEWDWMRHSIRSSKAKNAVMETMNYILSLSYFDLPLYLRSCLLYLTLFPEDYEIERKNLVHRWISEGLICGGNGEDLVALGEAYFYEFVNRSLIQPVHIGYDGKAEYCRVHDTILDFLIDKSTEENFCTFLSNHSKPDSTVRRLSLMGNEDVENAEQLDLSHARSLCVFGYTEQLPSLAKAKSLRVLDLRGCRGLEIHHMKDIARLYQIRYISISAMSSHIWELPREIGDLQYLETLDVSGLASIRELPETITRLQRLARLFVFGSCKLPHGFGKLVNLQELGMFDAIKSNHVEELGKLTNLRNLSIDWNSTWYGALKGNCTLVASALSQLDACSLRTLSIVLRLKEKDELALLPALRCVREVELMDGEICWISKWLGSLPNLEKITLSARKKIEQQDVQMISRSPNLVELLMWIPHDSGRLIFCQGFPQLQYLRLMTVRKGCIMFEAGTMPNLKELSINLNLSPTSAAGDIDFDIQHLSSLVRLSVDHFARGTTDEQVEAVEGAFKSIAGGHPNRPTVNIIRR